MSPATFAFQEIDIRRMPGFVQGGFCVSDLCEGINVIYGPNASGKTTTSRAIRKLLWPREDESAQATLVGKLTIGDATYRIEHDLGTTRYQQDGQECACPWPASLEGIDRYRLALHELLEEDNSQFAQSILRESAGGYDLPLAAEKLAFRSKPSFPKKLLDELKEAQKYRKAASQNQEELQRQTDGLAALRKRRDEAAEAQAEVQRIERALDYHQRREAMIGFDVAFQVYEPRIGRLTGRELADFDRIRISLQTDQNRQREEEKILAAALLRLQDCRLSEDVAAECVQQLRLKRQQLQDLARQFLDLKREHDECESVRNEARRRISLKIDDQQLDSISAAAADELFTFGQSMESHRARLTAKDALSAWLGPVGDSSGAGDLLEGVQTLCRWMAAGYQDAGQRRGRMRALTVTGLTVAFIGILLTVMHVSWLIAVLFGLAVALWPWLAPVGPNLRDDLRKDYEALTIAQPSEWTDEQVRAHVRQLITLCGQASLEAAKSARWSSLATELHALHQQHEELEENADRYRQQFGLVPGTEEASLCLLARNLADWQRAHRAVQAVEAGYKSLRQQYIDLLSTLNGNLVDFGYLELPPPEDLRQLADAPTQLAESIEDLESRRTARVEALRDVDAAKQGLDQLAHNRECLEKERRQLFERIGLANDDEPTLREWCRQREQYLATKDQLSDAQRDFQRAKEALSECPELLVLSADALRTRKLQSESLASELQPLSEEIGSIDQKFKHAAAQGDLEKLLTIEQHAAAALRDARDSDCEASVGSVLVEFLQQQNRDLDRPLVFRRASELFGRITHFRYRLDLGEANVGSFRAYDTSTGVGHALAELSSGTRVQLLLAVRIAFVEVQEHGQKLPLILDETLANSDERRAEEIIRAAIEISRTGRQVFYFTAKHDEVGKWQHLLRGAGDVPWRVVDLAAQRKFSELERLPPLDDMPSPSPDVPSPVGLNYFEYGALLQVPRIDLYQHIGGMHLWHVIDEPAALYDWLRRGINRWGQLQMFLDCRSADFSYGDGALLRRAVVAARVIDHYARNWRIGRGKPVDRAVLAESGAVSEKFIDEVVELADLLGRQARALMQALVRQQIKGFRNAKCEALRDFLIAEGFLDESPELSREEIRTRVIAAVPETMTDVIPPERLEQIFGLIEHSQVHQLPLILPIA